MNIKQQLLQACIADIEKQIQHEKQAIERAKEAANAETKSSAGDKYETGRAMMQMEQEKFTLKLAESLKLRDRIGRINTSIHHNEVQTGALVTTSLEIFFIAINIDEIEIDGQEYLPISIGSPLGRALQGKRAGDTVAFRNQKIAITSVE